MEHFCENHKLYCKRIVVNTNVVPKIPYQYKILVYVFINYFTSKFRITIENGHFFNYRISASLEPKPVRFFLAKFTSLQRCLQERLSSRFFPGIARQILQQIFHLAPPEKDARFSSADSSGNSCQQIIFFFRGDLLCFPQ